MQRVSASYWLRSRMAEMTMALVMNWACNAMLAISAAIAFPPCGARAEESAWPSLRTEIFGSRPIVEGDGAIILEAPERAEDAAIVPLTIRVPASVQGPLKGMWLIIDNNPAPVAATLTFGPAAGTGGFERRFSTRVRIDSFTDVHAVVETGNGVLHLTKAFVKASGGCSASAPKDADTASADLGKTLVKAGAVLEERETVGAREGLIMIRHPNNTGMQMDVDTKGYIPARYIQSVDVMRGGDLVFKAETGIAISANPNFRFTYLAAASDPLNVTLADSDGAQFSGTSATASTQ